MGGAGRTVFTTDTKQQATTWLTGAPPCFPNYLTLSGQLLLRLLPL